MLPLCDLVETFLARHEEQHIEELVRRVIQKQRLDVLAHHEKRWIDEITATLKMALQDSAPTRTLLDLAQKGANARVF